MGTASTDKTTYCCYTTYDACVAMERWLRRRSRWTTREIKTSLQQFGEFLLRARLLREKAAPRCVRRVRRFLKRQASDEPLARPVAKIRR